MTNQEIAAAFREIGGSLSLLGEKNEFRVAAYFKAAARIEQMEELSAKLEMGEVYFSTYLIRNPGVGEKSRTKIYQFLMTGTCPDLDDVRIQLKEKNLEYKSEGEPVKAEPKTRKASKNIREEVNAVRRPWTQADVVVQAILPGIQSVFQQAQCCGSYRRKKETVKDLDFVVTKRLEGQTVEQCFDMVLALMNIEPTNVIKKGEAQCSFYVSSPYGDWQVDLWHVEPSSWGSAILFATGSGQFNVEMRGWLKQKGMKLNRYGLWEAGTTKEEDVLLASAEEESIFKVLGLNWVPPHEREAFTVEKYRAGAQMGGSLP